MKINRKPQPIYFLKLFENLLLKIIIEILFCVRKQMPRTKADDNLNSNLFNNTYTRVQYKTKIISPFLSFYT